MASGEAVRRARASLCLLVLLPSLCIADRLDIHRKNEHRRRMASATHLGQQDVGKHKVKALVAVMVSVHLKTHVLVDL